MLFGPQHTLDDFANRVRPHLPAMGWLAARIAPGHDRDDIVQEALVQAWRQRRRPGTGSPELMALTAERAHARAPAVLELTDVAGPNQTAGQRLAADCVYFAGLSVAETAAVLGCAEDTAIGVTDEALREAGARWRATQPAPVEPDWTAVAARSRRPLWIVAAVLATAAVVVLAAFAWPSSGHPAQPAALVTAEPLVPNAPGAIVPAPVIFPHSEPPPILCDAPDLTGSLTFREVHFRQIGELRLHSVAHRACSLPGMLLGPTAVVLTDDAGRVQATPIDPRTEFPTNPPDFGRVPLQPGQTATMYLRPQANDGYCQGQITRATIAIGASADLTAPISGLPKCVDRYGSMAFWYGPFSSPGRAVALQPPTWSNLAATVKIPAAVPNNSTIHFQVVLANHGTVPVVLDPCPQFQLVLAGNVDAAWLTGSITCAGTVIRPGRSHTLSLSVSNENSELPNGPYAVHWAIAGVNTAHAQTALR